jgi:hypothetical protein
MPRSLLRVGSTFGLTNRVDLEYKLLNISLTFKDFFGLLHAIVTVKCLLLFAILNVASRLRFTKEKLGILFDLKINEIQY